MTVITKEKLSQGLTYSEYRKLIDDLLRDQKTTGNDHSTDMLEKTKLNVYRMNRIDSKIKLFDLLADKLNSINNKYVWVLLAEAWCGDAAQNLPVIAKMKYVTPNIDLRILLRDEHPDVMDKYLTNGGRSVPKLICLNGDTLEEIFVWGPRPKIAQDLILENKSSVNPLPKDELYQKLHLWYAQDKCGSVQQEFLELVERMS